MMPMSAEQPKERDYVAVDYGGIFQVGISAHWVGRVEHACADTLYVRRVDPPRRYGCEAPLTHFSWPSHPDIHIVPMPDDYHPPEQGV